MSFSSRLPLLASLSLLGCDGGTDSAPAALADTEIDGRIQLDENGQLVLDTETERFFEYLLSGEGEISTAAFEAWTRQRIAAVAPDPDAASQVWARFRDYRALRRALSAHLSDTSGSSLSTLEEEAHRLIETHLGRTAWASSESERVRKAFDALRHLQDTPQQGTSGATAASGQRRPSQSPYLLRAQLREGRFQADEAAGDRLAELEAKRRTWAARLARFRESKDALRRALSSQPEVLKAALVELETASLSAPERRRVKALETLDGNAYPVRSSPPSNP